MEQNKKYQAPAVSVVEVRTENMICLSPLYVIMTTDVNNSGSGNPLEDMDYNGIIEEF